MTIQFWQDCNPPKTTYQSGSSIGRRKDGGVFMYKNKNGVQLRDTLFEILKPHQPPEPMTGPLALKIKYAFPWRKSELKRNRVLGCIPCDKRPDCDNIAKQIQDVMGLLNYFEDDGQVWDLHVEKIWSASPGIGVTLANVNVKRNKS